MHRLLRRTLFTGSAALAGAVLWGAQSASADGGGTDHPDQVQEVVVDNSTTQDASAAVSSGQSNTSAPVSVGGGAADPSPSPTTPTTRRRRATRTSPTRRHPGTGIVGRRRRWRRVGRRPGPDGRWSATRPSSPPRPTSTTTSRTPTPRRRSVAVAAASVTQSNDADQRGRWRATATTRSRTSSRDRDRVPSPSAVTHPAPARISRPTCRTGPTSGPTRRRRQRPVEHQCPDVGRRWWRRVRRPVELG